MRRVNVMAGTACVLFLLNAAVWALQAPSVAASKGAPYGCKRLSAAAATRDELANMVFAVTALPIHPHSPCAGCTLVMSTTQTWCKYRPPGTECFVGPWFDNYRWQRPYNDYECGAGVYGSCCGTWGQNGCCNDSTVEPDCWDVDSDWQCSEAPNCP
jgi:hypothetical protein